MREREREGLAGREGEKGGVSREEGRDGERDVCMAWTEGRQRMRGKEGIWREGLSMGGKVGLERREGREGEKGGCSIYG